MPLYLLFAVGVLDDLFGIPKLFLRISFDLLQQTLCLLFLVSNQLTGFLLNFAGEAF